MSVNRWRKLGDRTIPRHTARIPSTIAGQLVDFGNGNVVLSDQHGGIWPAERVSYMGAWRPRPWLYRDGQVVTEGDMVMVAFMEGNWRAPVIVGIAAKVGGDLVRQSFGDGLGNNYQKLTLECRDSSGALTGSVLVEVHADDRPVLKITAAEGVVVVVGGLTVTHQDGELVVDGDLTVSGAAELGALPTPLVNQAGAAQLGAVLAQVSAGLALIPAPAEAAAVATVAAAWSAAGSSGAGPMLTSTTKGT